MRMIARARAAMSAVADYDQARIDRLCQALGWATANEKTFNRIVAMSIEESRLGDPEGRKIQALEDSRCAARCPAAEEHRHHRGDSRNAASSSTRSPPA